MSITNATDAAFLALRQQGYFMPSNPLQQCLPTSLNFTNDCLATADIYYSLQSQTDSELSAITFSENGLRTVLPAKYQNASLIDHFNYWAIITRLVDLRQVAEEAYTACDQQNRITVPDEAIDYSRNCSAMAIFWNGCQFDHGTLVSEPEWDITARFLQSSLGPEYASYSLNTLYQALNTTLWEPPQIDRLQQAASDCSDAICTGLHFSGNADLSGPGAMAAYSTIVVLSSLICLFSIWIRKAPERADTQFVGVIIETATTFADTLIFYSMMTVVASLICIGTQTMTVYELLQVASVTVLASQSIILMIDIPHIGILSDGKDLSPRKASAMFTYFFGAILCAGFGQFNTALITDTTRLLTDRLCYKTAQWPVHLVQVSAWLGLLPGISIIYLLAVHRMLHLKRDPWFRHTLDRIHTLIQPVTMFGVKLKDLDVREFAVRLLQCAALCSCWLSLITIYLLRGHGRRIYGASFDDNAMGYGQIVTTGFCLQAVFTYVCGLARVDQVRETWIRILTRLGLAKRQG